MKKVMLIDDMDIANFISKKIIELTIKPITVYDFIDPTVAFNQLEEINPDLIFLDLNMPVMDGWAFLERMKAENKHQYKVVILTSSTSEMDKGRGSEFDNVVEFLSKPLQREVLEKIFDSQPLSI